MELSRFLKKPLIAGCSKTPRYKASGIPRSEAHTCKYVATTRDEVNAVDGGFSAAC
jgi:hypothetical protein